MIGTDGVSESRKSLLAARFDVHNIYIDRYIVGERSQGQPEGSLFNCYYTEV